MSFSDIEAQLNKLSPGQLRLLALKSWEAYQNKESQTGVIDVCDENDPNLLSVLDEALRQADHESGGSSADEVRTRLSQWIIR